MPCCVAVHRHWADMSTNAINAGISASVITPAATGIAPNARTLSAKHGSKAANRTCYRYRTSMWFSRFPDTLNGLFLHHPALLYNLLFASTWETIAQFGYTKLQSETGMIAILHTWGQNLSLHPHLHCVVPGGGINFKGQWKQVKTSVNGKVFLFRVENLSSVFRGKFITGLQKQLPQDQQFIRELKRTNWVVYAKEPFAGPEQVIQYLGRYTHKVAIGNHRLLNVDETGVRFRWRDYRDNTVKVMTLPGVEFLRRFCQHILPRRFVRIRHYGLLSTARRDQLRILQLAFGIKVQEVKAKKHWKDLCREHLNYNPDLCPSCGKGIMITIQVLPAIRPPPSQNISPVVLYTICSNQ